MSDLLITEDSQFKANELLLAKNAAEMLNRAYPGHLWAVDVEGSVMNIRDMLLSGSMGYTLHIPAIYSASSWDKDVIFAGGEILERYNIARGKWRDGATQHLKRDVAGRFLQADEAHKAHTRIEVARG